ncbi:MAG: hypothetical protein WBX25_20195 [Rhodomicrobium sp.]
MPGIVKKYGVKICLAKEFGHDHERAKRYLHHHAGSAAIITLIDGSVHMATDPSSFEVWFDTLEELNDFLKAVGKDEYVALRGRTKDH